MNNVKALINLHSAPHLGDLTKGRHMASTSIIGRYAFIDFTLSNLVNSNIDNISILMKEHTSSIMKHIGNHNTYLKNSKTNSLSFFVNEKGLSNSQFNTDINNVIENDAFLYDKNIKYVIICPIHFVMKIDYSEVIKKHIESGKLVSVLYKETTDLAEYEGAIEIHNDAIGKVHKFEKLNTSKDEAKVYLETIIINREYLKELMTKANKISSLFDFNDLISYVAKYDEPVYGIPYNGYVKYYNSLASYMKNSFEMLDIPTEDNTLLSDNWPFYTTTHNTRPVIYGEHADISNCLIANGSTINGKVSHSILGRDVLVEEGAVVEDSILFTHTVVRKGVHLKNVVSDKRAEFVNKTEVVGTLEEPLYIPRGAKI